MPSRPPADPPSSWESLPLHRLDAYPRLEHRNLEQWAAREDRALDAAPLAPTLSIDDITAAFRPHLSPDMGVMEREIVAGLALSLWGAEHTGEAVQRKRERQAGHTSFANLHAALDFAAQPAPLLGMGELSLSLAPSKRNPNPARVGYDYPAAKQTSNGASRPRGLGAVELREDVARALSQAGVSPADRWLVEATSIGSTWALRPGPPPSVQRIRWPKEQGGGVGDRQRLSRPGAAAILRAEAARVLALCAVGLATYPPPSDAAAAPLLALRAAALADLDASDEAVSERITRARRALSASLCRAGLIPAARAEAADPPPPTKPIRWDSPEAYL